MTTEVWESAFVKSQMMWGAEPAKSAISAAEHFFAQFDTGKKEILIPGVGYGRNAKPFLERGMNVTGIEVSETAISLARSQLHLDFPIYHGGVEKMPFDSKKYDGIFCYGLIYLLDLAARHKLLRDCRDQLVPGGEMIFTVISKKAPMFGKGTQLAEDWYETNPGIRIYFYDAESIQRDFGQYGSVVEIVDVDEPHGQGGGSFPFHYVVVRV